MRGGRRATDCLAVIGIRRIRFGPHATPASGVARRLGAPGEPTTPQQIFDMRFLTAGGNACAEPGSTQSAMGLGSCLESFFRFVGRLYVRAPQVGGVSRSRQTMSVLAEPLVDPCGCG